MKHNAIIFEGNDTVVKEHIGRRVSVAGDVPAVVDAKDRYDALGDYLEQKGEL